MEKVYELDEQRAYDLIVVDTPPSQHALDFLEAPQRLLEFLDSRIVHMLIHPAFVAGRLGFRVFQRGARRVLQLLERVTGIGFLEDVSEFLLAFEGMSEGFRERASGVRALLLGPETAFVLVAGAGRDSVQQALAAARAARRLRRFARGRAGQPRARLARRRLAAGPRRRAGLARRARGGARGERGRGFPGAGRGAGGARRGGGIRCLRAPRRARDRRAARAPSRSRAATGARSRSSPTTSTTSPDSRASRTRSSRSEVAGGREAPHAGESHATNRPRLSVRCGASAARPPSAAEALARARQHARRAASEAVAAVHALLDAAALATSGSPSEANRLLAPLAQLLESLAAGTRARLRRGVGPAARRRSPTRSMRRSRAGRRARATTPRPAPCCARFSACASCSGSSACADESPPPRSAGAGAARARRGRRARRGPSGVAPASSASRSRADPLRRLS